METLAFHLQPLTAFGSPLLGDMLFGQLCWAARHRLGESRLTQLLDGYTAGRPFAVIANALPKYHLPRPALPLALFHDIAGADRKQAKRRQWIPLNQLTAPLLDWLQHARTDDEVVARDRTPDQIPEREQVPLLSSHPQSHNSINRLTGTTGRGEFTPYTQLQRWHAPAVTLVCRVVFDPDRISADELLQLFDDIGSAGFGRNASVGLGKFAVTLSDESWPIAHADANACLALAPCAPQGLGFDPTRSFYDVFTRFGRHGDTAANVNPFKTPLLLTRAGAIFTPRQLPTAPFVGQGLGGGGALSNTIAETVHQGYAPCVFIHLPQLEIAA